MASLRNGIARSLGNSTRCFQLGATVVFEKGAGVEARVFAANGRPLQGLRCCTRFPDGNGDEP